MRERRPKELEDISCSYIGKPSLLICQFCPTLSTDLMQFQSKYLLHYIHYIIFKIPTVIILLNNYS